MSTWSDEDRKEYMRIMIMGRDVFIRTHFIVNPINWKHRLNGNNHSKI